MAGTGVGSTARAGGLGGELDVVRYAYAAYSHSPEVKAVDEVGGWQWRLAARLNCLVCLWRCVPRVYRPPRAFSYS